MKLINQIKEYLTFTRSERNGIRILLVFVVLLMFVPDLIPLIISKQNTDFSEFEKEVLNYFDSNEKAIHPDSEKESTIIDGLEYFSFDPNTASYEDLIKLGLKYQTVNTIMKYLGAGGKFFNKTDLLKIYGIDSSKYLRIEPYIVIQNKVISEKLKKTVIELNSADSVNLKLLRGIGPVLAGRIIKFRNILGGFISKEQLKEVYGIRNEVYEEIKKSVIIDSSLVKKLDLNFATFKEILSHPYVNYQTAKIIIDYRAENGIFSDVDNLEKQLVINDSIYLKLKPYIKLGKKFE